MQFVAARLVHSADGFVDLFSADRARGFEAIRITDTLATELLGLGELAHQDMAVGKRLLDDKRVLRVVLQRVAEGGCFGGTLRGLEVADGLCGFT